MYVFHVSSYFSKGGQLIGEPINCCLWLSLGGNNDFPELASLLDTGYCLHLLMFEAKNLIVN